MILTSNSYAKVNIGLRVLGRRADGYHDLDTFFHLISLHDKITMTLAEDRKTSVSISGSEAYLPAGRTDLMEKAAVLFSAMSGKSFSLHSHMASFLRFMAANLSLTQLVTWAKPLYCV